MTRPVDPVGPLASVDRRKVERRDGQRRAPDASRSAVTPSSTPLGEGGTGACARPSDKTSSASGVDAAAVFAAQQLGQAGQKRGLRGGPPVLDAARSAYLGAEYSGSNERRPQPGRVDDTEA